MMNKAKMILENIVPTDTMALVERKMKTLSPRIMRGVKGLIGKLKKGIKNNRMKKK